MEPKQSEKLKVIAMIIKKKFTNLTVGETIDLCYEILEGLDKLEAEYQTHDRDYK